MAVNIKKVVGRAFRKLIDEEQNLWLQESFWTSAGDVEFSDGKTAQDKVGSINGITDDPSSNRSDLAMSAKFGKNLETSMSNFNSSVSSLGRQLSSLSSTVSSLNNNVNSYNDQLSTINQKVGSLYFKACTMSQYQNSFSDPNFSNTLYIIIE